MRIQTTLIVLSISAVSAFTGFIAGFHEGSRASLWSEFALRGILAGYHLEALEKGNKEPVVSSLKSEINLAFQAHSNLKQLAGYSYLSPLTGIELYGLNNKYDSRLEKYRYLVPLKDGAQ